MSPISLRTAFLGFLSWLVPFAVSFAFFDRTGKLTIAQPLFKSIMVVTAGLVGVVLLSMAFRRVAPSLGAGLAIGFFWLVINLGLDVLTLVQGFKMPLGQYLEDIGLRYLLIPIIAAGMGLMGARAASGRTSAAGQSKHGSTS